MIFNFIFMFLVSEVDNLNWNRWKTDNFSIMSLDYKQGEYLYKNIENIKKWTFNRWGIEDFKFSTEYKVICVPKKSMLKQLFYLDFSHSEKNVIWLSMDGKGTETIPFVLTLVCLKEYEKTGVKVPFWVKRGMSVLNGTYSQIRRDIGIMQTEIRNDSKIYFSKSIMNMTEDKFLKESAEKKLIFDSEAAILCLLVRKEWGQNKFLKFINTYDFQLLGLKNYDDLDASFKRYLDVLSRDVLTMNAPDSYLQITKE